MAAMYAVYHGPGGLKAIAQRTHALTAATAALLKAKGYTIHGGKKGACAIERPRATPSTAARRVRVLSRNQQIHARHLMPHDMILSSCVDNSLLIALDVLLYRMKMPAVK